MIYAHAHAHASVAEHNKSKYTDGKVSVILYDILPNKDLTTACPFLFEMTQGGLNEASTIALMRFVQNYSLQTLENFSAIKLNFFFMNLVMCVCVCM